MEGWIKVHRKTLESPVFDNPKLFKIWMYCLFKVTHKDKIVIVGKTKVELKAGQFIFGRRAVAEELKMNDRTVYDYMKLLEKLGMISMTSNNKFSVITVVNWGVYQSYEGNLQQQTTTQSTTQNATQNDTNKNIKKFNNVKNIGFHQIMKGGTDYDGLIFDIVTGGNGNT